MPDKIDYHKFVDEELAKLGMRIQLITEEVMKKDIRKFSKFINDAFAEYYDIYKWRKHADDEYLMHPLRDKFKYSYCIVDSDGRIRFLNFTSVLDGMLNNHFVFASQNTRGMNLAKYNLIKQCQTGLDNGYTKIIYYFSKKNNRSLTLFLKTGFEISHFREDGLIIAYGNNTELISNAYNMLQGIKKGIHFPISFTQTLLTG